MSQSEGYCGASSVDLKVAAPSAAAVKMKQERCSPPAATQFFSSTSDSTQVPSNQPVTPDLSCSVAVSTSTSSSVKIDCESSSKSQETVDRVSVGVVNDVTEDRWSMLSYSQVEMKGNQDKTSGREKISGDRDQTVSAVVTIDDKTLIDSGDSSDGGKDSDDSVKIIEPSKGTVIDIDDSDTDLGADDPVHVEPLQNDVVGESSSAGTQTVQQVAVDR